MKYFWVYDYALSVLWVKHIAGPVTTEIAEMAPGSKSEMYNVGQQKKIIMIFSSIIFSTE
jgi:hypothetical protein